MHHYAKDCLLVLSALLCVLFSSCGKSVQVAEYSIIPEPVYMVQKARSFNLTPQTRLYFENLGQNTPTAKYIADALRKMHVRPAFIGRPEDDCLTITLNDTVNPAIGDEGYLLQVRPDGIYLSANTEAGLFYAFQTFLQMLPPDVHTVSYKHVVLPECTILDYPRYPWRGSHLDVCRHFFTVRQIEKHLDLMAAYKLNKFYWQLSDNQGWRIEIEKYPALNDVGSWRVDRAGFRWGQEPPARAGEEPTYGGFYTKKEIAEIVRYAAQRNIEVIPCLELPGHCAAILAAYPRLSCSRAPWPDAVGPADSLDAHLCVGDDSVFHFLCDVLDELVDLFPSEYVHLGGTAAPAAVWQHCPRCQARRQTAGLASTDQLDGWFVSQLAEYLATKGKKAVGSDNVLAYSNSSRNLMITSCRGDSLVALAAIRGNAVVAMPHSYCDLSTYQADSNYHPVAAPALLTLGHCYQFDPCPHGLPADARQWVRGGVCVLHTDHIEKYEQAEYFLLPRLCALSECLWSPVENKDWNRFRQKIEYHKRLLAAAGYTCCKGSFKPLVSVRPTADGAEVTLGTEVVGAYVYYTTDGSRPTPESALYTRPLLLPAGTTLRTLTYFGGEPQEGIYTFII